MLTPRTDKKLWIAVLSIVCILAIFFVRMAISSWPRYRWNTAEDCEQEMYRLFPRGTDWKDVDAWIKQQPHMDWGSYSFDEKNQRGQLGGALFNKEGNPADYDDYIGIDFFFDRNGKLTDVKTRYLRGYRSARFGFRQKSGENERGQAQWH
jgi:hypothetical protein